MALRRIHLDAVGGVAGDMFVAAMLDAHPDAAEGALAAMRAAGLPIAGVETADKVKDKTLPSNTLMARWAESAPKAEN